MTRTRICTSANRNDRMIYKLPALVVSNIYKDAFGGERSNIILSKQASDK